MFKNIFFDINETEFLIFNSFYEYDGLEFYNYDEHLSFVDILKENNLMDYFKIIKGGFLNLNNEGLKHAEHLITLFYNVSNKLEVYKSIDPSTLEFSYEYLYLKDNFGFEASLENEKYIDFRPIIVECFFPIDPLKYFFLHNLYEKDDIIDEFAALEYESETILDPLSLVKKQFITIQNIKKNLIKKYGEDIVQNIANHGYFLQNKLFKTYL